MGVCVRVLLRAVHCLPAPAKQHNQFHLKEEDQEEEERGGENKPRLESKVQDNCSLLFRFFHLSLFSPFPFSHHVLFFLSLSHKSKNLVLFF